MAKLPEIAPEPGPLPLPERKAAIYVAPSAIAELKELWLARQLLVAFVQHDLQTRYLGSSVGLYWTVAHPLLQLITYTFVFHTLIGVSFHPQGGTAHYVLFLFAGMVTWNAFSEGLTRATTSLTEHAHLLRKMNFPAIVLPTKTVLNASLSQCVGLGLLIIGAVLFGDGVGWTVILVPVFVLIQAILTLGLALLTSTLQLYFRDTGHWISSMLFAGLFLTPVFYPPSAYPKKFLLLLYPNPLAQLIGTFQGLILNQHVPAVNQMLFPLVFGLILLVGGASVFAHNRRHFADFV